MRFLLGVSLVIAGAVASTGCFARFPPAVGSELTGCHPGAHGALSEHRCRSDADCVLCAEPHHCARVESRRHLGLTNATCPRPTAESCGGATASCCSGRCVMSQGPPPL